MHDLCLKFLRLQGSFLETQFLSQLGYGNHREKHLALLTSRGKRKERTFRKSNSRDKQLVFRLLCSVEKSY